jgi:hypothetical protein
MIDYVENYGNTVLCGLDGKNCNERETEYLEKFKVKSALDKQQALDRLDIMVGKPMNDDLRLWAYRRMRILKRLLFTQLTEAPDL